MGIVYPLDMESFRDFVQEVISLPKMINLTRQDYQALGRDEQNKVKRNAFVTPAAFKGEGETNRRKDNAEVVTLICMDIDDGNDVIFHNAHLLDDQLDPFQFVLYTTASHTPEEPRLRLIVEADNLPLDKYEDAVRDIARRIALPQKSINSETLRYVQPMYLPVMFKIGMKEEPHPLIRQGISNPKGPRRAYCLKDIPGNEGDEKPRKFKKTDPVKNDPLGELEYLKSPVEGVELRDMKKILDHIDPDCGYDQWISIAAAMRHQFHKEEDAEKAYKIFDEWSAKGDKYKSSEDTRIKWESFDSNPKTRYPKTMRSVLAMAQENGYDPEEVNGKAAMSIMDRIQYMSNHMGGGRLVSNVLSAIATMPTQSEIESDQLIKHALGVFKQAGINTSLKAIKDDLKSARKKERERNVLKRIDQQEEWAQGMVYIESMDRFMRGKADITYTSRAVDNAFNRKLLGYGLKEGDDESMVGKKSEPDVSASTYLLNVKQIKTYYSTVYRPDVDGRTVRKNGLDYFNTYVPEYPAASKSQAKYAGQLLTEHLGIILPDKEYQQIVLDFFAYLVQYPGHKVRWAPVIQGAQGCGKTYLYEMGKAILGHCNTFVVAPETLENKTWNEWAENRQLIALEEIRISGHNRHEMMNRFKPLVANTEVGVSKRYEGASTYHNVSNYIFFTNYHDALPLSKSDRRYCILKCQQQSDADVLKMNKMKGGRYFEELFTMLETHAGGLRYFFENHTISEDFKPQGHAPITRFKQEMIEDTEHPLVPLLQDCFNDHEDGNEAPALISPQVVSISAVNALAEMNQVPLHGSQVRSILAGMGYICGGRMRLSDGNRHSVWIRSGSVDTGRNITTVAHEIAENALSGRVNGHDHGAVGEETIDITLEEELLEELL